MSICKMSSLNAHDEVIKYMCVLFFSQLLNWDIVLHNEV